MPDESFNLDKAVGSSLAHVCPRCGRNDPTATQPSDWCGACAHSVTDYVRSLFTEEAARQVASAMRAAVQARLRDAGTQDAVVEVALPLPINYVKVELVVKEGSHV